MKMAIPTWAKVAALAALGGGGGFAMSASRTQACDCLTPQWLVRLREVTPTDPAVTHRAHWVETGTFSHSFGGRFFKISLTGTDGDDVSWAEVP